MILMILMIFDVRYLLFLRDKMIRNDVLMMQINVALICRNILIFMM